MRQDIHQEQPGNTPLSTATLAHADDRSAAVEDRAENRENRIENRVERRGSDAALRDAERPAADGGPTLVSSGSRAGKPIQEQNRTDAMANRPGVTGTKPAEDEQATPLFSQQESKDFFAKWDALQVGFIDEPRRAVEQADNLVAGAMKRLAEVFAEERARLEGQWDRGDNVSTEDLRVAMRRYRSFFRRLLAV